MITKADKKSLLSLQRHLADYRPYLERAIAAIKVLETADPQSEGFSDALAELHVSATVLEPYSEGMVEAIDQYTEDLPEDNPESLSAKSSTVSNALNQLPDEPEPNQPSLKELLLQLKQAIATDTDLPDTDKADLLEQVQNLAEAKQTEEPAKKEGLVRKAKKMFDATLSNLPETAKIAEACSKLLPLILKVLGFAV